ncbi:MAG: peroxidase [Actinomycetota bacterium]
MVQHGEALARESGDPSLPETVVSGRWDELSVRMAALCTYAIKLTRTPHAMREKDVDGLRRARFDDRAIVDANQVASYFNYVNRVADGLGVELEEQWPQGLKEPRSYRLSADWPR